MTDLAVPPQDTPVDSPLYRQFFYDISVRLYGLEQVLEQQVFSRGNSDLTFNPFPSSSSSGGSASLTATYVGFGDSGGNLTGDVNFTWDNANKRMVLGVDAAQAGYIRFMNAQASRGTNVYSQVGGGLQVECGLNAVLGLYPFNVDCSVFTWRTAGVSYATMDTTGLNNCAIGASVAKSAIFTTATAGVSTNIFFGLSAGSLSVSGTLNSALGYESLNTVTSGSFNSAFGFRALKGATVTGSYNAGFGGSSLLLLTSGSANTACGTDSLRTIASGSNSTACGYGALYFDTAGNNSALGFGAGGAISSGINNVAIGVNALNASTTTSNNVAIGSEAMKTGVGASNCTAVGLQALKITTAQGNTGIGYQSLLSCTSGASNVAVGSGTLVNIVTANSNTACGTSAGYYSSGAENTFIGNQAGASNAFAGVAASTKNAFVGYLAGGMAGAGTGSASNSVALGWQAGNNYDTGANNACIGYNAQPTAANVSNEFTLGDANITALRCAVTAITAISDRRDKKNIVDLPIGLDFLMSLKPRKFEWEMRGNAEKTGTEAGFIAQELQDSQRETQSGWLGLVYESNPERLEASAGKLIPVLVKAIQQLNDKVLILEKQIAGS